MQAAFSISGEEYGLCAVLQPDGRIMLVSYPDGFWTAESRTSATTSAVQNINDAPASTLAIGGTATQAQTLAVTGTVIDVDGVGAKHYPWLRDGEGITGASLSYYKLLQADVGHAGCGTVESETSAATAAVAKVNDVATGTVTISEPQHAAGGPLVRHPHRRCRRPALRQCGRPPAARRLGRGHERRR